MERASLSLKTKCRIHTRVVYSLKSNSRVSETFSSHRFNKEPLTLKNKMYERPSKETKNELKKLGLKRISFKSKKGRATPPTIYLPKSVPLIARLDEVVKLRGRVGSFSGEPTNLQYIATILRAGYGVSDSNQALPCSRSTLIRSVSNVGTLYPIDIYLVAHNINGVNKGVYRYDVESDHLTQEKMGGDIDVRMNAFATQERNVVSENACGVILFVARPWKFMLQYSGRPLPCIFHEVGRITQNIHLAMLALGMGSVDCYPHQKSDVEETIEFDAHDSFWVHSILFGIPDHQRVCGDTGITN